MRHAIIVAAGVLLAACSPKGGSGEGAADSTAAAPPADTAATPRGTAVRADSTGTKAPAPATKGAPVMGHDSAFGPSFMVDSTGKLIPIPKKKP